MSERSKRLLFAAGFVASVFAIGAALYLIFFKGTVAPGEPAAPGELPSGALPGSGAAIPRPAESTGGPASLPPASPVASGGRTATTALTQDRVLGATIAGDGANMRFYHPADGKFYAIDEDGELVLLSSQSFPEAKSVAWNEDADKAVIEFPDGTNVVYDFALEQQVTLPSHWEDFSFSPVSDQILAKSLAVDPNNRFLVTTNADGSNAKAFQPLGENADKVTVSWSPNNQVVAFSDTASPLSGGLDRKLVLPLGLNGENLRGLTVEGLGFLPNWAPGGKRLLYSVAGDYSSGKPLLWIVDATPSTMGENRRSLGLYTWADKCVFASASIAYCAAPRNLPDNAGLQRSLYVGYPDSLYKVDVDAGSVALVAIPEEETAMFNLQLSEDGGSLYFVSGVDGTLQRIRLRE